MSTIQIIIYSVALVILLIFGAFFSCAETGLMAVNRYRLKHKARLKLIYAVRLLKLLKRPDRVLGAILIGNTFANMLVSSVGTLIAHYFWGDAGALIAAFVLAFIVLIFSEVTPKTLAALYPEQVSRLVVYPIHVLIKILYPAVWFANMIANNILKLFRVNIAAAAIEPLSREELRSIVYDTSGKISRQYQNMLIGILDLSKLVVDDAMVPRNEIRGIDLNQSLEKMIARIHRNHYDWMPVYRESVNNLVGVLYTHKVLKVLLERTHISKEIFEQCLDPAYFVPAGTPLNIQLTHFQQHHDKVAFVVDEYGEIQGLLSLNDILEEIVGDFRSSLTTGKRLEKQSDGSFLVEGAITVREFNRVTDFDLPLGGPRTINGLIVEYLEALPRVGVTVLIHQYPIEVVQVKDNRVKLARVFPSFETNATMKWSKK
jgi:Mg2+/Co2+ transporter CorB